MVSTTNLNLLAHDQRVIELFDNSAPSYANGYCDDSSTSHFFKRRQEIVLVLLRQLRGGKLLDVGCGPGLMAKPCLDAGFSYSGIDISPRMIAECHKRFPDRGLASFSVGKMQSLPFPSVLFDVLLCMAHLQHRDSKRIGLSDAYRARRRP
jgi:ubiquinone/menaquinone biosynthesis C-methylase UbiE